MTCASRFSAKMRTEECVKEGTNGILEYWNVGMLEKIVTSYGFQVAGCESVEQRV